MKKIGLYVSFLAIAAFFASCDLNQTPVFNNADRFVAFDAERYSVTEDTGTVKIPVHFTSLGEKTTAVSFELFDGTAVAGRDYQLSGGTAVLNFYGFNPVQYISIDILPHDGVFTGDRTFGIALKSAANGANLGGMDTAYVTILDLDHPLAAILGTYSAVGTSYFYGKQSWTVTIAKDPGGDVTKVWITNLVPGGSSPDTPVYGVVNADKNKIEIPVGQTIATSASVPVTLEGFDNPDVDIADLLPSGSKLTMSLTSQSPATFDMDMPFGSYIAAVDDWYNVILNDVTFTKQ